MAFKLTNIPYPPKSPLKIDVSSVKDAVKSKVGSTIAGEGVGRLLQKGAAKVGLKGAARAIPFVGGAMMVNDGRKILDKAEVGQTIKQKIKKVSPRRPSVGKI